MSKSAPSRRSGRAETRSPTGRPDYARYLPEEIGAITNHQTALPRIARDNALTGLIEADLRSIPTLHRRDRADAHELGLPAEESVQFVLTSSSDGNSVSVEVADAESGSASR